MSHLRFPGTPTAAIVSFRLGCRDGVSVEAEKWSWALGRLGYSVFGVAGEGDAEHVIPSLGMSAAAVAEAEASSHTGSLDAELEAALGVVDLVVVENLCSLPLNPPAARSVARVLAGRRALFHHHDLPWQREQFRDHPPPSDDLSWRHVTVNDLSRVELGERGVSAVTLHNAFDPRPPRGRRAATRAAIGVAPDELVVLQPTRAIARKRVPAALSLAETLGATYWLLGSAEDGYDDELDGVLAAARVPVRLGPVTVEGSFAIDDAYAACDVVALPSSWEGFGNPALESATHRRPLFVGRYPVAFELSAFGFEWFFDDEHGGDGGGNHAGRNDLVRWLRRPERRLLDHNAELARRHFDIARLPRKLAAVLADFERRREPGGERPRPGRVVGARRQAAGSV